MSVKFFVLNGFTIDNSAINDCDIDDCAISGTDLGRQPLKEDKNKKNELKKHGLTIFISVLVHLVLFALLISMATKPLPIPVKVTQKAIKSYLYKRPIKVEKQKPELAKAVEKQLAPQPKKEQPKKEQNLKKQEDKKEAVDIVEVKAKKPLNPSSSTSQTARSLPQAKTYAPASFSAYKQLDKLRDSINNKIVSEELSQLQQHRSPSVMHGEQIPVPHSEKQLTPEQEREKNTIKMSDSISITKHDNGVCIIERDQFLGSPVEGSSSAFDCGESKFDKSFREHMKKVQAKLKPTKN